ncbi:MAG: helix-turn-helix domain-containing protein [Cyanobacteria bacterium]|nr:helix-turn-helix domain-containing protein [Cyanobacteriota bacterium]
MKEKETIKPVGGDNVWIELGFTEEEANELDIRSNLLATLRGVIQQRMSTEGETQSQVARILGTDQAKVSKILKGKLSEFSTDRLILFLNRLGYFTEVRVIPMAKAKRSRAARPNTLAASVDRPR